MRKFLINVNGNSYEVEVEEIRDGIVQPSQRVQPAAPAPVAPKAAPEVQQKPAADITAPKTAQAAPAAVPAGAKTVNAPMPGTILSINVKVGDAVKKGQVLCILEAMKMENEIMSGADGTVSSIAVSQGDSVGAGQTLFVIE